MPRPEPDVGDSDASVSQRTVERFREAGIALPTFEQLAEPAKIPDHILDRLAGVDPDAAHPLNLFRVHWYNADDRRSLVEVPEHVVLPRELTGVEARCMLLPAFQQAHADRQPDAVR